MASQHNKSWQGQEKTKVKSFLFFSSSKRTKSGKWQHA